MIDQIRAFKEKINKRTVYGLFSKTKDPGIVEAAAFGGFDFIIPDLEHGPNSVETLQDIIRAAEVSNILPIVRIKENNYSMIGEVLDIGAAGIQVPQVTNTEDVEKIVEHAKFMPDGMRGICRFVRAANYSSMDRYKYFNNSNETLIVIQLEGQESINNIDEILDMNCVDIVFIGPYDLSQSLGVPGQVDNPVVEEKMTEIISKCNKKGIHVGTFVDTLDNARKWEKAGVRYIAYSVDMGLFYDQCRYIIGQLK